MTITRRSGLRYGLLTAQLALALSGRDREEVVAMLMEMLLQREQRTAERVEERAGA